MLYNEELLIQAALEWEASDYRHLPTIDELLKRNLTWRSQVVDIHRYLEWVRKAAQHPQLFGSLEDALKPDAS